MKVRQALRGEWSAVAVCAAVFGLFSYLQPYWLDTNYFQIYLGMHCPEGLTFDGFLAYFRYVASIDNARIFNLLSPLIAGYLPKWLDAGLIGMMSGLGLWAMGKLIGLGRGDGALWWLLLAVVYFIPPWTNNVLAPVYSLNYIYPMALALTAVYLSLRKGWANAAGALALGLLAAWGHEGIGGLLLAGALPMMLIFRNFRKYSVLYIMSTLTAVLIIVLYFNTHMSARADFERTGAWFSTEPAKWALYNIFTLGVFAVFAILTAVRRWRRRLLEYVKDNPMIVFFLGVALASVVLNGMVIKSLRATLWPQRCSMIALAIAILPLMRQYIKYLRPVAWIAAALMAAAVAGEVYVSLQYRRSYNAAIEQLERPGSTGAFVRFLHPLTYPSWVSRYVPKYLFMDYFQHNSLDIIYEGKGSIVPEELRYVDAAIAADSVCCTPGGVGYYRPSEFRHVKIYAPVTVTTRGGRTIADYACLQEFTASDGTQMAWLQPLAVVPDSIAAISADITAFYTDDDAEK